MCRTEGFASTRALKSSRRRKPFPIAASIAPAVVGHDGQRSWQCDDASRRKRAGDSMETVYMLRARRDFSSRIVGIFSTLRWRRSRIVACRSARRHREDACDSFDHLPRRIPRRALRFRPRGDVAHASVLQAHPRCGTKWRRRVAFGIRDVRHRGCDCGTVSGISRAGPMRRASIF